MISLRCSLFRGLVLMLLTLLAGQFSPGEGARASERPPAGKKPATKAAFPGRTIVFHGAPWRTVLEWLSDWTGRAVVGASLPSGTFTFLPPKPDTTYTIPEVIDILNETLRASTGSFSPGSIRSF
jgi:hypothetical protein